VLRLRSGIARLQGSAPRLLIRRRTELSGAYFVIKAPKSPILSRRSPGRYGEAEPVNDFETPSRLSLLSNATRYGGDLKDGWRMGGALTDSVALDAVAAILVGKTPSVVERTTQR
jgi:hypothetical protein